MFVVDEVIAAIRNAVGKQCLVRPNETGFISNAILECGLSENFFENTNPHELIAEIKTNKGMTNFIVSPEYYLEVVTQAESMENYGIYGEKIEINILDTGKEDATNPSFLIWYTKKKILDILPFSNNNGEVKPCTLAKMIADFPYEAKRAKETNDKKRIQAFILEFCKTVQKQCNIIREPKLAKACLRIIDNCGITSNLSK